MIDGELKNLVALIQASLSLLDWSACNINTFASASGAKLKWKRGKILIF